MANSKAEGSRSESPWRIIGWSLAGSVLLIPLVAMQFTKEVQWTVGDFMFAALLIGLVGTAFELAVREHAGAVQREVARAHCSRRRHEQHDGQQPHGCAR